MQYYSESRRPKTIALPATNSREPEYQERTDPKTGKKYLKQTGEINVYEKIQEAKQGTSLKELINRYGIDPQDSAVKIEENIFDYTTQPTNLMDALERTEQARDIFNNASKEIKQEFNNNFSEFLAGAVNGKLQDVLKKYKPQIKQAQAANANDVVVMEPQKQDEVKAQKQDLTPNKQTKNELGGIRYE